MTGKLRCTKCDTTVPKTGSCPQCGNIRVYIDIYHHKRYKIRKLKDKEFGYIEGIKALIDINSLIKSNTLNIYDWLHAHAKERSFERLIHEWLDSKEDRIAKNKFSFGTRKNYHGYVFNYLMPALGKFDVREIDTNELERFADNLPESLKKKTHRNILNALHSAFKWFWKMGYVAIVPPFPRIEGKDANEKRALSHAEQIEGLDRIPERYRDIIEFGIETGLRSGELCALKKFDLRPATREIVVQRNIQEGRERDTTKGRSKTAVPLSDRAWAIAANTLSLHPDKEHLFINPDTGRRYTVKKLNQVWREFSGTDVTFNEAGRHSFCSQLVELETNPMIAQQLMRHSDIRTTQKYYHPQRERLREALNKKRANSVRNESKGHRK